MHPTRTPSLAWFTLLAAALVERPCHGRGEW